MTVKDILAVYNAAATLPEDRFLQAIYLIRCAPADVVFDAWNLVGLSRRVMPAVRRRKSLVAAIVERRETAQRVALGRDLPRQLVRKDVP